MPEEPKKRPCSRRRRLFRLCRQGILLLLVLVLLAVLYLNQIGLPSFIKDSLLARLQDHGVQVDFSRLRWRWHEGVVAENLVVRQSREGSGPEFQSAEARVQLRTDSWLRPKWNLRSVDVKDGQFSWLLPPTSGLPPLKVDAINGQLKVEPDGTLNLQNLSSTFKGLQLHVSGTLAHPAALPRKPPTNTTPARIELLNRTMTRVANYLTNFSFPETPALELSFQADAADWDSLSADLELQLPKTKTTWGSSDDFKLHARIRSASSTNAEPACTIQLSGTAVDTPWGRLENWHAETLTVPVLQLPLQASNHVVVAFERLATRWGSVEDGKINLTAQSPDSGSAQQIAVNLDLQSNHLQLRQGTAGRLTLHSESTFNRTNAIPFRGRHEIEVHDIALTNLAAAMLKVDISQLEPATNVVAADPSWGFWTKLQPFRLNFELAGQSIVAKGARVDTISIAGSWTAPKLELHKVHGTLYGGEASAELAVDVPERRISGAADVAFNFHGLDPVFTDRFRHWFAPYQWEDTPHATVTGKVNWPDWRNLKPNWREDVAPTIGISGKFHVNKAFYKGIPGDEAFSDFHFTNFVWNLPNLTIVRPEGRAVASYEGDEQTKDFVWNITGDINPQALKPLFSGKELKVFDSFTNYATPHVEGTIWGRWRDHDRIGFHADVNAPKTLLRGEYADLVTASVDYTNRFLTIHHLEIQQSNRVGHAESLGIDLPNDLMYFTNIDCGLPPQSVARAIGPVTAHAVEPYIFDGAPRIRVNGVLGLKGHDPTDMKFEVAGGPFHWWRFNIDQIEADLLWRSNRLELNNVATKFYDGQAAGAGSFQFFTDNRPTEFSFALTATNAQLRPLVHDVFFKTNGLEGALSGALEITSARADSLDTWQGTGKLHLRDGVVWDIPIFGIFSPIFNAISPGLGQSRADEAVANFSIVNGTVISRDLVVRSPEFSMVYQGSVDFMGDVDARMQARILRDSGVLGPLISAALWPLTKIFEYHLSGTLSEPVAEPVHIPRFLFMALEPFKALQGVLKGVGQAVVPKQAPGDEPPKP